MKAKQLYISVPVILLTAVIVLFTGCTVEATDTTVAIETSYVGTENVTAREAYALIEENRGSPDFVILDIRTPEEFAEGRLENAENIDFNAPDFAEQIDKLDREKTYLVYCRSGNRSGRSIPVFEDKGFRNIYHMDGGIIEWTEEELPLVE